MQTIDFSALDGLDIPHEQKATIKAQMIAQWKAEQSVVSKEFSRHKQDSRKRALDLAHSELSNWTARSISSAALPGLGKEPNVVELADKYYKWLIEIPD